MHTKYFTSVDEVEFALNKTFTAEQYELVGIYIHTGIRPDSAGCWTCTPGYIRMITGDIDEYERAVEAGEKEWPWAKTSQLTMDDLYDETIEAGQYTIDTGQKLIVWKDRAGGHHVNGMGVAE